MKVGDIEKNDGLFCEIGTSLIVKKELLLENDIIVEVGEKCRVEDIIGFGFDIISSKGIEIRVMNSGKKYKLI